MSSPEQSIPAPFVSAGSIDPDALSDALKESFIAAAAAAEVRDASWFERWLGEQAGSLTALVERPEHAVALRETAGDLGWVLYEWSMTSESRGRVPSIDQLRRRSLAAEPTAVFVAHLLAQFFRFGFRFQQLDDLLHTAPSWRERVDADDPLAIALGIFVDLGRGDVDLLPSVYERNARCRGDRTGVDQIILHALWLAPFDTLDDVQRAELGETMISLANAIRVRQGSLHSSIHLRLSRAHHLLGDERAALREINLALDSAESSVLSEQYVRERGTLLATQAIAAEARRRNAELEARANELLVTTVAEVEASAAVSTERLESRVRDAEGELRSRVESAIGINIQMIFSALGFISIGATVFGVVAGIVRYDDLLASWAWWQVALVAAGPAVALVVTSMAVRSAIGSALTGSRRAGREGATP